MSFFPTAGNYVDAAAKAFERARQRQRIIDSVGGVENIPESGMWCLTHDKAADKYGLCYGVKEDKPEGPDCKSIDLRSE